MKILVTGAAGFIGSHIVEGLAKQGLPLRAAHRPGEVFHSADSDFIIDGLDLEIFPLDIRDRAAVFRALAGVQILFHADYLCSFASRDKALLYAINQQGTQHVMEAALHHGVEKIVYTSGIEVLAPTPKHEAATETDGVALEELKTHFEKSRYLAEREVLRLKAKGLPVILVHPTVCLGSGDREPSPFGNYLRRYLQGKARFYLDTGFNLVDVVDVAKGHLLAAKRGRIGARYILGHRNVYMLELLRNLQAMTGIPAPRTALPMGMAALGNTLLRGLGGKRNFLPNPILKRLRRPLFFDSTLAREELGMPQSNVWEALRRYLIDLKKNFGV
ncbi:MAG TPA: NAD-dependent dehydratase [Deltaproteobacteria bacterium]|nr:NAD-dependent dehydratase [Deltaproteobacteria bacterium]